MTSVLYAIGDIHGRADLLRVLHRKIAEDSLTRPGRKRLVYLGDYVDRGPDSAGVIDTIMAGPPPGIDGQVCLRGNHEELMLAASRNFYWRLEWRLNGGAATKRSYGKDKQRLENHLSWLETLPLTHLEGGFLFVHAGIVPGRPLGQQKAKDLLWIRERFLTSRADHGFVVVHGHTPVGGGPDVHRNRINIDTGAVYGGALTCVVLDPARQTPLRFLSVSGNTSVP